MKALPLWQPWASLVGLEAKRIETRHWPAPAWLIGQRVAIHACKTSAHLAVCAEWPFRDYIAAPASLPLGALVCTAVVARCSPITPAGIEVLEREQPHEHAFGLYTPGRFAWVLRDVQQFAEPIPFIGRQGIFDVPDELLSEAA